jgi:DNA mismatch endonuclease (patch repair protein)
MTDKFSKEIRSMIMSRIRSTETNLEIQFRKELWNKSIRYRKNDKSFYGNPDLSNKKKKTVVFLDSCFWHGCDLHCRLPKSNTDYWEKKIIRNRKRDQEVTQYYEKQGWKIIRLWEHVHSGNR